MRKLFCDENGCKLEAKSHIRRQMASKLGAGGGGFISSNRTYLKSFGQNKIKAKVSHKIGTGATTTKVGEGKRRQRRVKLNNKVGAENKKRRQNKAKSVKKVGFGNKKRKQGRARSVKKVGLGKKKRGHNKAGTKSKRRNQVGSGSRKHAHWTTNR